MKNIIDIRPTPERALLLAVAHRKSGSKQAVQNSIDELGRLAVSAGATVVRKIIQNLPVPSHESYVGKGKLEELVALQDELHYNVIILDDELTPNQQRNLEDALNVKVIDRAALILDIFPRRAQTHEGRLQVELAQHQYLLPRLTGQWLHLERLGGGIGTRGPGESQLETDRRMIRRKIQKLREQTEDVRKHRALYRQRRQKTGIPVVALVGYTNAGKSTLLNALCEADIYADNRLFATLDPTTRRRTLPDGRTVLFSDTVGFIRKLPPTILDAFRATLEELNEADLLLHVVDLSSGDAADQCQTVEEILDELELSDKPRLTVLNKTDRFLEESAGTPEHAGEWDEETALAYFRDQAADADEMTVHVSAVKRWGLAALLDTIADNLR
ncbi:MAG: GTPase HflX [Dehalococcoidales bacterium]|nr:GTPase HflX [Dehalococcoidales bacterium]